MTIRIALARVAAIFGKPCRQVYKTETRFAAKLRRVFKW